MRPINKYLSESLIGGPIIEVNRQFSKVTFTLDDLLSYLYADRNYSDDRYPEFVLSNAYSNGMAADESDFIASLIRLEKKLSYRGGASVVVAIDIVASKANYSNVFYLDGVRYAFTSPSNIARDIRDHGTIDRYIRWVQDGNA